MSTLYELYNKRTKYRTVRENVSNAINVLSRNNSVVDNISTAESILANNYLVNEAPCKANLLREVRDSVEADLNNLETSLSSINSKIYTLTKEIEEKEAEEAMG